MRTKIDDNMGSPGDQSYYSVRPSQHTTLQMAYSSTLVYTIHTCTYLHVSSTAIQMVSSSVRYGLFQTEEKLVAEYLDIMRTNAPSLWRKPKTGILFSLCMPQRQRPVLLVRMRTADADLYSWPAFHLLFRREGKHCFLSPAP